jgi:hypothetical protein
MNQIIKVAERRHELHKNHASSRPLSPNYETIGLAGEFAFGRLTGIMPDLSERPTGDGGVDFHLPLVFTVDVKTAEKAFNLLHEVGKEFCDIYVLAQTDDSGNNARLVGWEWGSTLKQAPTKDFGRGIVSHYIPREKLKPMSELAKRLTPCLGPAKCQDTQI